MSVMPSNLPIDIENIGKRFFIERTLKKGISLFQFAKLSISFLKEGKDNEYFILSGIVKENRHYEAKIVFKQRLIDHKEGPLKTQCNCTQWNEKDHCPHTSFLFLYYYSFIKQKDLSPLSATDMDSPYLSLATNPIQAVYPESFGTMILAPKYLIGAAQNAKYTSLQYSISNGKISNFPEPKNFTGKLVISITTNDSSKSYLKTSFLLKNEKGELNRKVSLFENFFLFNWITGDVYNLPFEIKSVLEAFKYFPLSPNVNDYLEVFSKKELIDFIEIIVDGEKFQTPQAEEVFPTLIVDKSSQKNFLNMNFMFLDRNNNKAPIPPLLKMITMEGGVLSELEKKSISYDLLKGLHSFLLGESPQEFRKSLTGTSFKTLFIQRVNNLNSNKWSSVFQDGKFFKISNNFIRDFLIAMISTFSEKAFQNSKVNESENEILFYIKEPSFLNGVSHIHKQLKNYDFKILFNNKPIKYWNNQFKSVKKEKSSSWLTLELSITPEDLQLIKSLDLKSNHFINKNDLVLISDDQKKLLKYLKRYTLLESENQSINRGNGEKTYLVSFNRTRIFEIFELKKLGVEIDVSEDDTKICNLLTNPNLIPPYEIPENLKGILRPYQKRGYNWLSFLFENNLGGCLADDMGLGKTLQAICFLESVIEKINKVLIVCPISILLNWEKEFQKFTNLSTHIFHGENRVIPKDKKIILTSYGILRREFNNSLTDHSFDILILDEVQQVKNINSLGAFAVRKIKSTFTVCLTGTPVENNIMEFYNIIDLSMPGIWGNTLSKSSESTKKSRLIAQEVASPFILRRTKSQVLLDLPKKIENNILLPFSKGEREHYDFLKKQIKEDLIQNPSGRKFGKILTSILRLRQCCLFGNREDKTKSTKANFLFESLNQILKEGHQSLIFSQFTSYLDYLESYIKKNGWQYSRIDGSQNIKRRQIEVENFQEGKTRIFLISLKAGGFGLNLTAASYIFLMDPWWNPAIENQAIDRAHRIGQKNTLTIYRPIIEKSIEEKVLQLQETKKELFHDLLPDDGEQYFSNRVSLEDLENLID
tara:strand:- start:1045 stop:4185 length:3141 start_codon:yes stop_codon:yes gene_type:complete